MSDQFWNNVVEHVRTHGIESLSDFTSEDNATKRSVMTELENQFPNTLCIGGPGVGKTLGIKNLLLQDFMNERKNQYIIISAKDDLKDFILTTTDQAEYETTSVVLDETNAFNDAISFISKQKDKPYVLFMTKQDMTNDHPGSANIERLLHELFLQRSKAQKQTSLCIVMDELPSLGDIQNVPSFVSMNQTFGMEFILSTQHPDQLKALYGAIEGQMILDHTKHFLYPPKHTLV